MKPKELKNYRTHLFRDAAFFRKPERIPHLASVVTWKVFDAGHTLDEALTDFDVMKECVVHFLDTYPVDSLLDTGIRNQFGVTEAFGTQGYYYYNKETLGIRDHAWCPLSDLEEYVAAPEKYIWEKALPNKYPDWYDKDLSVWNKTLAEYCKYIKFIISMGNLTGKYGVPGMAPNNPMNGAITFGIEHLLSSLLGIKEMSIALRRDKAKIKNFVDVWDSRHITPLIEKIKSASDGPDYKYCFDASILMLAQNILNRSQFEELYWEHLEPLLTVYAHKEKNARIFTEGTVLQYADFFSDIPKGAVTLHIENDDPFEVRKRIPNAAICGGLTAQLLSEASPEECVARVKLLIDELGREGGFILSEDKMLSYRNDARSENYKAVCDFVSGCIL